MTIGKKFLSVMSLWNLFCATINEHRMGERAGRAILTCTAQGKHSIHAQQMDESGSFTTFHIGFILRAEGFLASLDLFLCISMSHLTMFKWSIKLFGGLLSDRINYREELICTMVQYSQLNTVWIRKSSAKVFPISYF